MKKQTCSIIFLLSYVSCGLISIFLIGSLLIHNFKYPNLTFMQAFLWSLDKYRVLYTVDIVAYISLIIFGGKLKRTV